MRIFLGITLALLGAYVHNVVANFLLSKMLVVAFLLSLGFTVPSPIWCAVLTNLLLGSRLLHVPLRDNVEEDLRNFVFYRSLLRNQTFLMLLLTGGTFLGLALPAVVNYPLSIGVVTVATVLLIAVVEQTNRRRFDDRLRRYFEKTGDFLESVKRAYSSMVLHPTVDPENLVKDRLEVFRSRRGTSDG